jgi:hypothetical protein
MRRLVAFFRRHGQWVVFVMRFSPAMRTMISLPAGLAKMGHARFWCSPSPGRRSGTRCWSGPVASGAALRAAGALYRACVGGADGGARRGLAVARGALESARGLIRAPPPLSDDKRLRVADYPGVTGLNGVNHREIVEFSNFLEALGEHSGILNRMGI